MRAIRERADLQTSIGWILPGKGLAFIRETADGSMLYTRRSVNDLTLLIREVDSEVISSFNIISVG